jgi:hypothetical protein
VDRAPRSRHRRRPARDASVRVGALGADSSQAIAIEETRAGADLVIQGPPGTGKSQTIANIIASAVHGGRSVLFVAEKAAALEVVHTRLKNVGLDPLCLELHSRKATKATVLGSIQNALYAGAAMAPNGGITESLSGARDRLNRWTEILHRPIGASGRTPYQVMGQVLRLRADGTQVLADPILDAGEWDANRLRAVEDAVDRAAAATKKLGGAVGAHPWKGATAEPLSPFDVERLRTALDAAALSVNRLDKLLADARSSLRAPKGNTLEDVPVFLRALRLLAQMPAEGRTVFIDGAWRSDRKRIAAVLEDGQVWQELEPILAGSLTDAAWDLDFRRAHQNIAAYGRSPFRFFFGSYRQAIQDLRAVCRDDPPRRYPERLKLAEQIVAAQSAGRRLEGETEFAAAAFGPLWRAERTQWELIGGLLTWADHADALKPSIDLLEIGASGISARWDELANELEAVTSELRANLDRITSIARLDLTVTLSSPDWDQVSVSEVSNRIESWRSEIGTINDWIAARDGFETARGSGAEVIVRGLINGSITPAGAPKSRSRKLRFTLNKLSA